MGQRKLIWHLFPLLLLVTVGTLIVASFNASSILRSFYFAEVSRDLEALGTVSEGSALAMHASALAARPAVIYWRGATIEAFHAIRDLRKRGIAAWSTIDAGPHIKVLCHPESAPKVAETLEAIAGIDQSILCRPGPGASLQDDLDLPLPLGRE